MARPPTTGSPPRGNRPRGQAADPATAAPPAGLAAHRAVRVVAGVVVVLVSAVVAVLAAIVSRMIWRNDVLSLPWGLVLAVAASTLVVLAARTWLDGLAFVAAGAWIVVTGLVLSGRPEGDYLFAQDGLGLGYLGLATVGVMGAAALGRRPR